ncbi:GNAT family N-acetyltransferase [Frankia canadensis]|uniref:GNAT family N-acetyltransferase n=1 Tax=Frankia canadensis TaxID=1836972 RepID=UPI001FAFAC62|nr:GNAT family N-acetyltransferase [Frankia canadensis]
MGERAAASPPDPLFGPRCGLSGAHASLARELELVAHRAWPPLAVREHRGWLLRASAGSSRRGNSVWARGDVPDLAAGLAAVETFYRSAGLPPTFQLTPVSRPSGLPAALDDAGYDDTGPTDVCSAPLAGLTRADAGSAPAGGTAVDLRAGPVADEGWLRVAGQVFTTFDGQRVGTLAVLARLRLPTTYVTLTADGVPVAVGRGVTDGRWLGIYSMATLPAARGRGAARRVLGALARWAAHQGATHAYLQVEEVSTVARRLYAELGFRPVYRYSYRRAATPAPAPVGEGAA